MIYKEDFLPWLKDKIGKCYYNGSKTEIITLCPWCEKDSDKKHGHLYISVDDPVFYCQRCGEKGIIVKLIHYLQGDFDQLINPHIIEKTSHTYTKKNLLSTDKTYTFSANSYDSQVLNYKEKYNYLSNRIGKNLDIKKIPGLIFSLKAFIKENQIEVDNWQFKNLDYLDEKFIGFLTTRKTAVILRNCDSSDKYRYYKFLLGKESSFFIDFYSILSGKINSSLPNIVLCEGVFDLLVPCFNEGLKDLKKNSVMWAATLGKGSFLKTLTSVLNYLKIVKANVNILSDRDVPIYFYNHIKNMPFVNNLNVFYNKLGKDFGCFPIDVMSTEIKLKNRSYF